MIILHLWKGQGDIVPSTEYGDDCKMPVVLTE